MDTQPLYQQILIILRRSCDGLVEKHKTTTVLKNFERNGHFILPNSMTDNKTDKKKNRFNASQSKENGKFPTNGILIRNSMPQIPSTKI